MIITVKKNSTEEDRKHLMDHILEFGLKVEKVKGDEQEIWCILGSTYRLDIDVLLSYRAVSDVRRISEPYHLVSRKIHPDNTIITLDAGGAPVRIGDGGLCFIAGPCTIESEEQLFGIASRVRELGASVLRGGAYKPRSSPYSFQGLKDTGIKLLAEAGRSYGLPVVSEITDISQLKYFDGIDIIQVGARNMQNFELLKELGCIGKPILLKRGISAAIKDLLMSAEYLLANGNSRIILCERGIRTFETAVRSTLDLSAVPILKELTHLPVLVDPSHATGSYKLVKPMALASVPAGADGLMIEVHDDPESALCDGMQSIYTDTLGEIIRKADIIKKML